MDPVKLSGIADWPTLNTLKQVLSFLGFGNYYRRFIQGYGNLTRPLNELLEQQYALVIDKLYQCKYSQGVTPLKDTLGLKMPRYLIQIQILNQISWHF